VNVSDPRLRVTGWFVEPDEKSAPLLLAMGQVVWGAAALEKSLLLELARLRAERDGQFPAEQELSRLEHLPAGPLLKELRKLDLPGGLDERIGDAIDRRNQLFHHPVEDPEMVAAIVRGEDIDAVVKRVEQLAIDCGELAVELQAVAVAKLEAVLGKSQAELVQIVQSVDPATVEDPHDRRQLEAIIALGDADLSLFPPDDPGSAE
jgi:hypothetical protein